MKIKHLTEHSKIQDRLANSLLLGEDRLIDTKEVETRFKVSRTRQCRLRKDGGGPAFYIINGRILYSEMEYVEWLNGRRYRSSAELPDGYHGERFAHLPAARKKVQPKATEGA